MQTSEVRSVRGWVTCLIHSRLDHVYGGSGVLRERFYVTSHENLNTEFRKKAKFAERSNNKVK